MQAGKKSVFFMAGLVAMSVLLVAPNHSRGTELSTGTLDIRVATGDDDAEESKSSGNVDLNSSDLELIHEDSDQIVGIRFRNVLIPPGSTITNAYIAFTVDETSSLTTSLTFRTQKHDNAPIFSSASHDVSNRQKSDAAVVWNNIPSWGIVGETGVKQQTPDLSAIVQEVVARSNWAAGNAMVFIIEGSGKRVAESYDGDSGKAPLLHVEYTSDAIERRIAQYDDDAEERRDQNGDMDISSSDLDLLQDRLIGLRFQNITVPRGAEITRAYITLCADETNSNSNNLRIDIELNDDPPAFTVLYNNISHRTLSGNPISWQPVPSFASVHATYQTPDLSALVQQIVGRTGWQSGNSLVFVLEARSGNRVAESYDGANDHGNLGYAPMLHIEYGEGEIGTDEPIISVDTTSIGSSVYETSNPDGSRFAITNTGTGALNYQLAENADWLTLSSTAGSLDAGHSVDIGVTFLTAGLSAGTYETTIVVVDPNALNTPVEIQVSVTVLALPEDLTCGNLPLYTQNLVSPAILVLLDISGSMDDMMDVAPQQNPRTPDLKAIVQEIIDRPGWAQNNAMAFIIQGAGKRVAKSYEGSSSEAALLHVEYDYQGANHTFEKRVSQGNDDAEENQAGTSVSLDSSDLEMVNDGSRGNQTVGLRFQNVAIPEGTVEDPVTITRAYIEFTIDESNDGATNLTIWGEDMDNPSAFADSGNKISGRTKTAHAATWSNIEAWSGVTQERRIDIAKSVISDLVKDRAISWGFGTWCNSDPWDNLADYTIIHEGTKQNSDEHQAALQSVIAATHPNGGTPFSFSIEAAKNYFEGTKADETGSSYVQSDCQPKFLIEITDGMGNTGSTVQNTRTRAEALAAADVTGIGVGFGLNYSDAEQLYVLADVANDKGNDSETDQIYALHPEVDGVAQPFFAFNKQELTDRLNTITESVKGAIFHGSAPAPTTSVDLGDMVIVAKFDASRWSGDIDAVTEDHSGLWINKNWTASQNLPATRKIWTVLDPDDPATVSAYTTGTLANDNFQCVNQKPIGDIINSTPVVVGFPPFWYPFDGYRDFARNLNREPMIYVGANDGLLHAFRLADGVEQWSFLPHNLQAKLDKANDPLFDRCAPEYCHQYYVDGNPIAADVYADFFGNIAKEWRTVLMVGEREGGQAYFALDVTSGKSVDDPDPTRYLWEFTDSQLGETWGDPAIERVAIKDVNPGIETAWGAYFGSGYMPIPDQQASKQAYIYGIQVNDADDLWKDVNGNSINRYRISPPRLGYTNLSSAFRVGELVTGQVSGAHAVIIAIDNAGRILTLGNESGAFQNGEGLNGNQGGRAQVNGALAGRLLNDALASPLLADLDGDYIMDRIYVGNLYGNMYRVSSIGKDMTPQVSVLFDWGNTSPNENPIRARADYGFAEEHGEIWVYFGSGRYESQADKQDNHQQYFFGLKDGATPVDTYAPADLVSLQAKFATAQIQGEYGTVRVVEGTNVLAQPWKIQLYEGTFPGGPAASGTERVVSQPLVVGGLVFFTTFIPDEDICAGSGTTWVFAVDYKTGLAPLSPVFDLNGDKRYDDADKVEVNGEKVVPIGIYVGRGQGSKPVLHKDTLFITTTGDGSEAGGDGGGGGQDFFAKKVNIEAQIVRLENWRHK
jgi:hypothetical protein